MVRIFRGKAENGALKGGGYIGEILRHTELVYEPSYDFPCNSYLKLALGIVKAKRRIAATQTVGMAASRPPHCLSRRTNWEAGL
jgi:hypothetical protein